MADKSMETILKSFFKVFISKKFLKDTYMGVIWGLKKIGSVLLSLKIMVDTFHAWSSNVTNFHIFCPLIQFFIFLV